MPNQNPSQKQGQSDPKKGQPTQSGQFDPKKGQKGRDEDNQSDQKNRDKKQSGNY